MLIYRQLYASMEKEMATHSSVLAWRIPGTGEPGGLPSMGSHRVGHDWSDLAAAAAYASKHTQKTREGFLGGSVVDSASSPANARNMVSIAGLGRSSHAV